MNSFPEIACDNFGGISKFYFIPVDDADSISEPDGMVVSVTLKDGKVWFEGESSEDIAYTEEYSDTDSGDVYSCKLSGFYPGDSDTLLDFFNDLRKITFLVMFKDLNEEWKLLGTLDIPCRFRYARVKDKERNGFNYSFGVNHYDLPPFFVSE